MTLTLDEAVAQLSDEQCLKIVSFAMENKAYDDPGGKTADQLDPAALRQAAVELTQLAHQVASSRAANALITQILEYAGMTGEASTNGASAPAPAAPAPAAAAPTAVETDDRPGNPIEEIIPGYDDLSKPKLLEALAGLDQDQLDTIKSYEREEGARPFVLNFELPKPPEPEPTPAPTAFDDATVNGQAPAGTDFEAMGLADLGSPESLEAAYENKLIGFLTVTKMNLPQPGQGNLVVAENIGEMSDVHVAELFSRASNWSVIAMQALSEQEARVLACDRRAEQRWNEAYARAFASGRAELGDKANASQIERVASASRHAADADDNVVKWKTRQTFHAAEVRVLKSYQEGYSTIASRMSREQSRREALANGK